MLLPVTGIATKPGVCRPKLLVIPTFLQRCDAYIVMVTDLGSDWV